ncbi:Golgi transport complex subunit 3 [Actinomortierella ambigua]|nr:Golgi transport complex subunit 3 [Actinomortierella ambigua]
MTTAQARTRALDWDTIAPLSELQRQSVLDLKEACIELPIPSNLASDGSSPLPVSKSSSSVNTIGVTINGASKPGGAQSLLTIPTAATAALGSTTAPPTLEDGLVDGPIETTYQFFDWFAKIEGEMERDQEDVYRNYLAVVELYSEACVAFLQQIDENSECFKQLEGHYAFVEEKTCALQQACEKLLQEQTSLQGLADSMAAKLSYFHHFEVARRLLDTPGEDVCMRPEFAPTLMRLDECIDYVEQNLNYRDSELYQMRFRRCMTRGMTLIKMHFISKLRGLSVEVASKKPPLAKGETLKDPIVTNLYYVKFKTIAPPLKKLVSELETRCEGHKEYNSLLNDCYNCYFSVRQQHLAPLIVSKIQEMGPSQRDKLMFARSGLAYLISVCMEEYSLFYSFFNTGEDALYNYLDSLIGYLYDYLRPRIIHENKIDILSELCAIMNMQQTEIPIDENSTLAFGYLIRNMLQDTQHRLVYRAQAFIRSEIQGFHPKPDDLNYPERLQAPPPLSRGVANHSKSSSASTAGGMPRPSDVESIAESIPEVSSPTPSLATSITGGYFASPTIQQFVDTAEIYYGWYPTLQTTLWLLTKLYKCVPQSTFDDLSQEALSKCLVSLNQAATMIKEAQGAVDGQLFLIKHLLILKEQIAPFEGNFVHITKEVDFSRMTDAITKLFRDRSNLLSFGSWLGAVSQTITPTLVDSYLDARQEIDRDLKVWCETFILDQGKAAVESLAGFMNRVAGFRLRADIVQQQQQHQPQGARLLHRPAPMALKDQPFARLEELKRIMLDFKETTPPRIQWTASKLSRYLKDPSTEEILMRPIQSFIIESYQSFYDTILYEYDPAYTARAQQQMSAGEVPDQHPGLVDLMPLQEVVSWVKTLVQTELTKSAARASSEGAGQN